MSERSEQEPQFSRVKPDEFPSPERWAAMQGGRPRIFGPAKSFGAFQIVHVYDRNFDPNARTKRPHYGTIVPTEHDQMMESLRHPTRLIVPGQTEDGRPTQYNVAVPAVMFWERHGRVCQDRSRIARGVGYDQIKSPAEFDQTLDSFHASGLVEYRLGLSPEGEYILRPVDLGAVITRVAQEQPDTTKAQAV